MKLPRAERIQRVTKTVELIVLGVAGAGILAFYLGAFLGKQIVKNLTEEGRAS